MVATPAKPSAPRANRLGRILIWPIVVIVVLALVGYFAVGAVAANALTQPRRDFSTAVTPAQDGMAYEDVRFPARGGEAEIAAWFIPAADDAPPIIMVHGRDASRTAAVKGIPAEMLKLTAKSWSPSATHALGDRW